MTAPLIALCIVLGFAVAIVSAIMILAVRDRNKVKKFDQTFDDTHR